jgi:hypothetical protein
VPAPRPLRKYKILFLPSLLSFLHRTTPITFFQNIRLSDLCLFLFLFWKEVGKGRCLLCLAFLKTPRPSAHICFSPPLSKLSAIQRVCVLCLFFQNSIAVAGWVWSSALSKDTGRNSQQEVLCALLTSALHRRTRIKRRRARYIKPSLPTPWSPSPQHSHCFFPNTSYGKIYDCSLSRPKDEATRRMSASLLSSQKRVLFSGMALSLLSAQTRTLSKR